MIVIPRNHAYGHANGVMRSAVETPKVTLILKIIKE